MDLLARVWPVWIVPVVLVVFWARSWRGTRRRRLLLTLTAPVVSLVPIVLGIVVLGSGEPVAPGQPGSIVEQSLDSIPPAATFLILQGAALLLVALALLAVTLLVECALLIRRHCDAW